MELTIEKKYIEDIVRTISQISLKGVLHPALKLSRINIKDKKFTISATNLSLAVEISFNVDSVSEIEYFVDTVTLERVLSGMLTEDNIIFSFKDSFIEIKTKKAKARIPYNNGEDVPTIPVVTNGKDITIPAVNFKKSLTITLPGASNTDIKPELSSIFMSFKDNLITSVATDAFQLIEYTDQIRVNENFSILLPAKEAASILKILENTTNNLDVVYSDTLFKIKTNTITIITKLNLGMFPDYESIIPKNQKGTASFLRRDLDMALKFLMQLRSDTNHVHFEVSTDQILFSVNNVDGGQSEYLINAKLEGETFFGNLMSSHLKTLASNIPNDGINLSFFGDQLPFIATGSSGANFKYLMMPVSVK